MVLSWYQNVSGRETWVGHLRRERAWGGGIRTGTPTWVGASAQGTCLGVGAPGRGKPRPYKLR